MSNHLEKLKLQGPDAIFNSNVTTLIEDCQRAGISDHAIAEVLMKDYIGSPSAIRLINEFKTTALLPSTDEYLKKAFITLFEKKISENFELDFDENNPPSWLDDCLSESFFRDLFTRLHSTFPNNKLASIAVNKILLKKKEEEALAAQKTDLVKEIFDGLNVLENSDKDDFEDLLPTYIEAWTSKPLSYLFAQLIMHGLDGIEVVQYMRISRELEDFALADPTKHNLVYGVSNLLNPLPDEEFSKRLFNALSKPNLESVPVIKKLYNKCLGPISIAETRAMMKSSLVEKLVRHTFLADNPTYSELDEPKNMVLMILAFIHTASFTEGPSSEAVRDLAFKRLTELYIRLKLPFNKVLEAGSDLKSSLYSYILIKYVHHYIKETQYYEQTFSRETPKLHTVLLEMAHVFPALRPDIVQCLFECLKAPTRSALIKTETKLAFKSIINTILEFLKMGQERLVIDLFKENIPFVADEYLEHAFKKLLKIIKPPFSNSFAIWVCEWLSDVASSNRIIVLRTPPIRTFLATIGILSNLKATTKHPLVSRDVVPHLKSLKAKISQN